MINLTDILTTTKNNFWLVYFNVRFRLSNKYRASVFGYLWSLMNPLLILITTAFVFSNIFGKNFYDFFITLSCGMIPWLIFSNSVNSSTNIFFENEALIRKIKVPKFIFPLINVISLFIEYFLVFIFYLILVYLKFNLNFSFLFLLISFFLFFVFVYSVSLIVSILTVIFRDMANIVNSLIQVLFFLTPIIYDKSSVFGGLDLLMKINPLSYILDLFKDPILNQKIPDLFSLFIVLVINCLLCLIAYYFYSKTHKKIVFSL